MAEEFTLDDAVSDEGEFSLDDSVEVKQLLPPEDDEFSLDDAVKDEVIPDSVWSYDETPSAASRWYDTAFGTPSAYTTQEIPEIASHITREDPTLIEATASRGRGLAQTFKDDNHGVLYKGLVGLTAPEQIIAANTVQALQELEWLPAEHAASILGQEEVHMNDILEYYWRPSSPGGRATRAFTGLLADIIFDPLTYMSLGASAGVRVGSKLYNLQKLGRLEQKAVKIANKLDGVVSHDGKLLSQASADKVVANNKVMLEEFADGKLGMQDLVNSVELSNEGITDFGSAMKKFTQPDSLANDLAEEYADMFLTARIPFTKIGKQVKVPMAGKAIGQGVISAKWASGRLGNSLDNVILKSIDNVDSPMARELYNRSKGAMTSIGSHLTLFKTNTNNPLFDQSRLDYYNKNNFQDAMRSKNEARAYEALGEADDVLLGDVVDHIEMTSIRPTGEMLRHFGYAPWEKVPGSKIKTLEMAPDKVLNKRLDLVSKNVKDPAKRLEKMEQLEEQLFDYYKTADPTDYSYSPLKATKEFDLLKPTADDLARYNRIKAHPMGQKALDFAEQVRVDNLQMVQEYYKRFPWFSELNPFGKDWARGYLKHIVTRDWLSNFKTVEEGMTAASRHIENYIPKIDKSSYGRDFRETISAANAESKINGKNVPIFETDPVKAHFQRQREMNRVIENHDFLEKVLPLASTKALPGHVPMFTKGEVQKFGKGFDGQDIWDTKNFIPQSYKEILRNGDNIYFPEHLKTRLDYMINPRQFTGMGAMGMKALQTYNYLFRNAALFGPGYLGQNFKSNLITYGYAGGDVKQLGNAIGLSPMVNKANFSFNNGKLKMTRDELYDNMYKHGIIRTGIVDEVNWRVVTDNMKNTKFERAKLFSKKKAMNVVDVATMYRANRWAARFGDDYPKMALYMSKLDEGYSFAGAADNVNFWYFNFIDRPPYQGAVTQVVPFSSFALKTAEQTAEALKKAKLAHLTLPPKVNDVLQGFYGIDEQQQTALDNMLPEYRLHGIDSVHGPLLPGGKEIMIDIPWAKSTLSFLFNPDGTVHPLIQLMASGLARDDRAYSEILEEEDYWNVVSKQIETVMPPPVLHGLTMLEMSGAADVPMLKLKEKYAVRIPKDDAKQLTQNGFYNAMQFGSWMRKKYGDNVFYNMFFYGNVSDQSDAPFTINQRIKDARYGNWIRRHFRGMSLGTVRVEAMDRNFMMNYSAMSKELRKLGGRLYQSKANQSDALIDPSVLKDKDKLSKYKDNWDEKSKSIASEMIAIDGRREALMAYYEFYLMRKQDSPGFWSELFGFGEDNFNFQDPPPIQKMLDSRQNTDRMYEMLSDPKFYDPMNYVEPEAPAVPEGEGYEQ